MPFVIADEVYEDAHRALLKAFYYFRCGTKLDELHAGPWQHGACHLTPAIVHGDESRQVDAWGGWHDAGDYGKYVVPGAKAVVDLLLAFEFYPEAFAQKLPLPESDGRMPDVLHECRYELEWMLRMQEESGGVFHKLTTLRFPAGDVMPEDDTAPLYLSPISATATGCFAGVMAMSWRIYSSMTKPSPQAVCRQQNVLGHGWRRIPACRDSAIRQISLQVNTVTARMRMNGTGPLQSYTAQRVRRGTMRLSSISQAGLIREIRIGLGGHGRLWNLRLSDVGAGRGARAGTELLAGLLQRADELTAVSDRDGYGISLLPDQYIWGSNMVVLNHAMLLLVAGRLSGSEDYERHVHEHIHYVFGANVMGMSYVTGFGDKPILHPHHRPSEGDGVEEPVPGLVSGGPNKGLHDDYAREHLAGKAPAASFADVMESYSTNEVAIYWNSPAVFVLSHFV